jgi:hypothetical protein
MTNIVLDEKEAMRREREVPLLEAWESYERALIELGTDVPERNRLYVIWKNSTHLLQ